MHGNRANGSLNEAMGTISQKVSISSIFWARRFFLVACLMPVKIVRRGNLSEG